MAKAEKKTNTPTEDRRGRSVSPENQKRLDFILKAVQQNPGVSSPTIAKELEISTLQCSQLADRLVRKGEIVVKKVEGGIRTYHPA